MLGIGLLLFAGSASAQDTATEEAYEQLQTGNYDRARALYEALINDADGPTPLTLPYFETYLAVGRYQEGLANVDTRLRTAPNDPYLLHMRGRFLAMTGQYSDALQVLLAADQQLRNFWRNKLEIAFLLEKTGQYTQARNRYIQLYRPLQMGDLRTADDLGMAALATARLEEFREANNTFRTAHQIEAGHIQNLYWWGDLFREKYNTADAQRTFEEALSLNPNWADLYVGYARTYNSFARQEELAQQALSLNPNHVDAMNMLAGLRILDADYQEAQRIAERALAINPSSEEALAHLASVHHLRSDSTSYLAVEERALAVNRRAGRFYLTISKNVELRFRYRDAVNFAFRAIGADGGFVEAYAALGIGLHRIGRTREARRYLEATYDRDPFNLFVGNTLTLLDAYADFRTLESEHFTLLIHASEADVLGPTMLHIAEACYADLQPRFGYVPEGKIVVEAYNDHDDFAVRVGGIPHLGLLGVSFGDIVALDTPRAQQGNDYNWARTLWHELAHTMAIGLSDHRVPRWFTEGLSVYEEKRAHPEWGREMELELFAAHEQGHLLPIAQIDRGFTRPTFPGQIILSYYHASRIIGFIVDQHGFDAITGMLRAFGEGLNVEQSFRRVLGQSTDTIQEAFDAYLEQEKVPYAPVLAGIPNLNGEAEESLIDKLTGSEQNAFFSTLERANAELRNQQQDAAEASFKDALDLFEGYIGPGNAYVGLAALYRARDQESELMAILERYLAVSEFAPDEARELGDLYAQRGDTDRARQYYERSIYLVPYDMTLHAQLADWYEEDGDYGASVRARRAVLALDPVDRAQAQYALAYSLYRHDQKEAAKRAVLQALEMAPGYREAQKLLLLMID